MSATFITILKNTVAQQHDSLLREMFHWQATAAQLAENVETLTSQIKKQKEDFEERIANGEDAFKNLCDERLALETKCDDLTQQIAALTPSSAPEKD